MKKIIILFIAIIMILAIFLTTSIAEEIAEQPIPAAYMWQDTIVDENIFVYQVLNEETHEVLIALNPHPYKDNIRAVLYKCDEYHEFGDHIDPAFTSDILQPGIENGIHIILPVLDEWDSYVIAFESVSLTEDGEVDETKMIYTVASMRIDGATHELLQVVPWEIETVSFDYDPEFDD
jgi:hypothetical protein